MDLIVTPTLVQDLRETTYNYLTQIHIGRAFKEDGAVPHLGVQVPRWYGETIGFWDGEALITWTSNIQGWVAHASFEYSNKMQSIEIYTPIKNDKGEMIGFRKETILYDDEALVDPVRIVHYWDKTGELGSGEPIQYVHCFQTIFPIKGEPTQNLPGDTVRILAAGHLRPSVGPDLGEISREGHGTPQAEGAVRLSMSGGNRVAQSLCGGEF